MSKRNQKNEEVFLQKEGYLRLWQVLTLLPISKTAWWSGIKAGKYPAGVKIGEKMTAWRVQDIRLLFQKIENQQQKSSEHK